MLYMGTISLILSTYMGAGSVRECTVVNQINSKTAKYILEKFRTMGKNLDKKKKKHSSGRILDSSGNRIIRQENKVILIFSTVARL